MEKETLMQTIESIIESLKIQREKIKQLEEITNGKPYLKGDKIVKLTKTWRNKQ